MVRKLRLKQNNDFRIKKTCMKVFTTASEHETLSKAIPVKGSFAIEHRERLGFPKLALSFHHSSLLYANIN